MKFMLIVGILLSTTVSVQSQPNMLTARQHYEKVLMDVKLNHGDSVFFVGAVTLPDFGGVPINIDPITGRSQLWIYAFLSSVDQQQVAGLAVDDPVLGRMYAEVSSEPWAPGADTIYNTVSIKEWWVDSDTVAITLQKSTMGTFMANHLNARPFIYRLVSSRTQGVFWRMGVSDGPDSVVCSVSAYANELIECISTTAIEANTLPSEFNLGQPHPTPVTSGQFAEIDLIVEKAGPIRVEIFDVQGRLLGTILDHDISPGTKTIIIPNHLIRQSGIYLIHVRSATGFAVRKLVVT